jgi:hypothetical protein
VRKAALILALVLCAPVLASAWRIQYKEQFYKLYHEHLHEYPADVTESMYYLEQALKADFANPLYALARIADTTDWERYRDLFMMHVNLRLVYLSLTLGSRFDKREAFFYNAPWQKQNLESLQTAEQVYRSAIGYWEEARRWSGAAWGLRDVHLEQIQDWEDENLRIETGDLDYRDIIEDQLARVARVRSAFESMGPGTY